MIVRSIGVSPSSDVLAITYQQLRRNTLSSVKGYIGTTREAGLPPVESFCQANDHFETHRNLKQALGDDSRLPRDATGSSGLAPSTLLYGSFRNQDNTSRALQAPLVICCG